MPTIRFPFPEPGPSAEQDGTALGVNRQLDDCRRLADDLGWAVAEEYVDNDLSACP